MTGLTSLTLEAAPRIQDISVLLLLPSLHSFTIKSFIATMPKNMSLLDPVYEFTARSGGLVVTRKI